MNIEEILKTRPNLDDYDLDKYMVNALENYIDKLEKAINYTRCCEELVCDHPENRRTYRRSGKDSYCNKCEKMVKEN